MSRSFSPSCSLLYTKTPRDIGIGTYLSNIPLFEVSRLIGNRTIHGMVYNAMKLFMEINPQLFDDCSHEYTENQSNAPAREAHRQSKWARLEELAKQRKVESGTSNGTSSIPARTTVHPLPRLEEVDGTEDNQKRLDSLKLQDGDRRERRPGMHERQSSVGSSRSR